MKIHPSEAGSWSNIDRAVGSFEASCMPDGMGKARAFLDRTQSHRVFFFSSGVALA